MQQSIPTLPIARYSCSLSFTTISGHTSIVVVHGDLSGLGIRPLYTFSLSDHLGSIDLHALPTHIPLSSPLIAVLNPDLLSPWVTPSATGVVYNDPINPQVAPFNIQVTLIQPPELGGGTGFRITVGPGRCIDLSLITGTTTSLSRLYRVTRPAITPVVANNPFGRHIVIGRMKLSRRSGVYKMELHFENSTLQPVLTLPPESDDLRYLLIGSYIILRSM